MSYSRTTNSRYFLRMLCDCFFFFGWWYGRMPCEISELSDLLCITSSCLSRRWTRRSDSFSLSLFFLHPHIHALAHTHTHSSLPPLAPPPFLPLPPPSLQGVPQGRDPDNRRGLPQEGHSGRLLLDTGRRRVR